MPDGNVRMAVLDDGVHPWVCSLKGRFNINDDLKITDSGDDDVSLYSHGSMCTRIVKRYTDLRGVEVYSIQILHGGTCQGNIERLLQAFKLCASLDIRLVHLSVGTYAFEDFARLEKSVCNFLDSERILVASAGNKGTVTYPAYLPGVFGVQCHPGLVDDKYLYCYDELTRIHFQASAKHKLTVEGERVEIPLSNSYATPVITAKILSYLKDNTNLKKNEIMHRLVEDASIGKPWRNNEAGFYPPVEIPVVLLSGFTASKLSHLLESLMGFMYQDDYNVRVASDLPGIRPWTETVLPKQADLDDFAAWMAWYFSCEIILLGIVSYVPPDKYRNISLWIYGEESVRLLKENIVAEGQVLRVVGISDDEVYENMIGMLT